MQRTRKHSMPFGAELHDDGRVRFRLWAPSAKQVDVCLQTGVDAETILALADEGGGWYGLLTDAARVGTRYRFRIDGETRVPDPASRFQPDDVHGPSEVIDPQNFVWSDGDWRGRPWHEAVIYELHVGSATPEGNYRGLIAHLDEWRELGVTAMELMPLADFPGARNWGYDGVLPFAPDSRYGRPEELKEFIAAAHARGLMVFLDVVYNHFGPEGNYLHRYAQAFFTERHHTPWGAAINFDGADSRAVRDFFINNALYWLEEYHFDGLRLDAVHAIRDDSQPTILTEIAEAVARGPGAQRTVHLVLENDDNAAHYLAAGSADRSRYTAQWNDDIHHALHVLVSGEQGGYYADYSDRPMAHLGRCLTQGFAYQGEPSVYRDGAARGEDSRALPLTAFVSFLQNHDQVGNRARGERISAIASTEAVRAATEVLLLAPAPPLLFMGQEWAAPQPFLFFCDFGAELADAVTQGRRKEFSRFPEFRDAQARERIPDPNAPQTFSDSCLDWTRRRISPHREWLAFHAVLLRIRHQEVVPHLGMLRGGAGRFQVLDERVLEVDWPWIDGRGWHMSINFADVESRPLTWPAGRTLYGRGAPIAHPHSRVTMPPWSVWLCLAE